ncbi:hydrogenase maturation nickel metallochaperone HypA [Clostridium cylindrosporum]|uniref:Hydrogenase maturation factor HypA n=1 Tax=Clostridium cylindrosporum DSM 605 TaxID=1121307 RepID=A0A0J8DDC7_CLOCY|nr:hydrogenase maturation nickel metallochaperone HypA [Clostridium cylindrosporum]KMT22239.1 hydrogenase nickel insertion protein HypA [Clostridium cylindrosporum DSM 605]
MHEVSMICSVIEMVEDIARENNIKKVTKVILKIGEFTCTLNSALNFAFQSIKKNTICSDAVLEIENVNARAFCDKCQREFDIKFTERQCPTCNEYSSNIISGEELLLYRIEGE